MTVSNMTAIDGLKQTLQSCVNNPVLGGLDH